MYTIIKNVNILTMNKNKEIIENGIILIKDDIIFEIGNSSLNYSKYKIDKTIDGNNGILIPGMINTHTHVSMVVFRSLADDVPDRLKKYIFPLEKEFVDKDLVYIGAKYGIAEMQRAGVTTFTDMYYFEDEVAKAAKEMNIRAILGETVMKMSTPDGKEPYYGLEYGETFIKKWKNDSLIIPAIAPHAPYTNNTKYLKEAYKLSKKYNVPITMHVAEMKYELEQYKEEYNMTPVQYLDDIGILDENFIAAHCVLLNEEDIDILEEKKVGIAHNMGANSKGAKGVAPIKEMYKREMKIGLGTDGPMSGNTLDIMTQMSLVPKIQKLFNDDRSLFPASQILEMATIGGARALNIDKITGSIEIGKKADIAIIETNSLNMQPVYDYYSALVYSANASNVDTVLIDGKIILENKEFVQSNIFKIKDDLLSIKNKIKNIVDKLNS